MRSRPSSGRPCLVARLRFRTWTLTGDPLHHEALEPHRSEAGDRPAHPGPADQPERGGDHSSRPQGDRSGRSALRGRGTGNGPGTHACSLAGTEIGPSAQCPQENQGNEPAVGPDRPARVACLSGGGAHHQREPVLDVSSPLHGGDAGDQHAGRRAHHRSGQARTEQATVRVSCGQPESPDHRADRDPERPGNSRGDDRGGSGRLVPRRRLPQEGAARLKADDPVFLGRTQAIGVLAAGAPLLWHTFDLPAADATRA